MASAQYIVVTLHNPRGFGSTLLLGEAQQLPVETMSAGFSQIILVFAPSELSAARDFTIRADTLRATDPVYQQLQVGVAFGSLRVPLPKPMPEDEPVVIESFKSGLSQSRFLEEFDKIDHTKS
jgi:hypothetical protein